jgi:hypothetical protein
MSGGSRAGAGFVTTVPRPAGCSSPRGEGRAERGGGGRRGCDGGGRGGRGTGRKGTGREGGGRGGKWGKAGEMGATEGEGWGGWVRVRRQLYTGQGWAGRIVALP